MATMRFLPENFEDWTSETIRALLERKVAETVEIEFKAMLPHRSHGKLEEEQLRTRKALCAFANANGGYLIYGVKDKGATTDERLVGMEDWEEFPKRFSDLAARCTPAVAYEIKQPPIPFGENRVFQVVYVPKSDAAPHAAADGTQLHFLKRVPGGAAYMSLEEIRNAMVNQYERRLKLELLRGELENLKREVKAKPVLQSLDSNRRYIAHDFDVSVLKSVLPEVYSMLRDHPMVIQRINEIRAKVRYVVALNQQLQNTSWQARELGPAYDHHNRQAEELGNQIDKLCSECLMQLEPVLRTFDHAA